MGQSAKAARQNRIITVDFQDQSTYFQLISNGKAFVEFVLAFILSIGFQLINWFSAQLQIDLHSR
jgi:hypothetical protein